MGKTSYTTRDGKLRLYDGTATPYYLEIAFVAPDFRGALGRPRPVESLHLDRGRLGTNMHMTEGPDDPILTPTPVSFSFKLLNFDPNYQKWRAALNIPQASTWTVGANTWVSTKASTQVLSGGESPTLVTTPAFIGPRRRTVNLQVMYIDPAGSADIGTQWAEVEFEPDKQQINEAAEEVTISASGMCYGSITEITAFTSGTAG